MKTNNDSSGWICVLACQLVVVLAVVSSLVGCASGPGSYAQARTRAVEQAKRRALELRADTAAPAAPCEYGYTMRAIQEIRADTTRGETSIVLSARHRMFVDASVPGGGNGAVNHASLAVGAGVDRVSTILGLPVQVKEALEADVEWMRNRTGGSRYVIIRDVCTEQDLLRFSYDGIIPPTSVLVVGLSFHKRWEAAAEPVGDR